MGADAKANPRGHGLERGWRTEVIAARSCPSGPRRERLLPQGGVCSTRDCEHACGDGERAGVSAGADRKAGTGAAEHSSSLSTPFPWMQLAMMMAEATPSRLLERLIASVGFVPLSSSI